MDAAVEGLIAWKGLAVVTFLVVLFAAERLWPAAREIRPAPGTPRGGLLRLLRNGALWLCTVGASSVFVLPVSVWAAGHDLGLRPAWWQGWHAVLVDVLVLDFLIYWWHRANHGIPFLWRFHEIHHLDRFLDTTTALRFHFGEVALSALARAIVIVVLGVPLISILVFESLVLMGTLFHHSNLRLPSRFERALSRLVITPSIHWVHHHAVCRDTDSNYGTLLSVWDPLFATRSQTVRDPAMEIGVEHQADLAFIALLLRPFRVGRRIRAEAV
jgi:sterol desaturase/sphingolipid hydroxylase (fatty acid hydroxylase superfamily)